MKFLHGMLFNIASKRFAVFYFVFFFGVDAFLIYNSH
jgi:hypothetical protein